jgi:hypothetical protein
MDPVSLATTVTSFLIPYLTKVGGNLAEEAGNKLWDTIVEKFKDKPAADGAAEELKEKADDPDNQEAFILQLKKAFKDDPDFAKEIADLLVKSSNGGITNTDRAVATNGSIAVGDLSVSGDVTGNIVVGSGNSINQSSSTGHNKSQKNTNDLTE